MPNCLRGDGGTEEISGVFAHSFTASHPGWKTEIWSAVRGPGSKRLINVPPIETVTASPGGKNHDLEVTLPELVMLIGYVSYNARAIHDDS